MKNIPFVVNKKIVYVKHEITTNKHMYLKVTRDNHLVITSPKYVTEQQIIKTFAHQITKFLKYIDQASTKIRYSLQDKFIFYDGKKLTIEFLTGFLKPTVQIKNNKFYIMSQEGSAAECTIILENYLKQEMMKYLKHRQPFFEHHMHVPPHKIRVSYKFSTWASNNIHLKSISYSSRLMHFDGQVRDYVIVHELAHYFEHKHSQDFYTIVATQLPHYQNYQQQLLKNNINNI